jgi:hypothetical protein
VNLEANNFTIPFSEDDSMTLHGSTCAAVLHSGTYSYHMSEDGDLVLVGGGKKFGALATSDSQEHAV